MKAVFLTLIFLLFASLVFCQLTIPEIKNGQVDKRFPDRALAQPTIKGSEVVIIYRFFSFFSQHGPFHIINYGVDKKWHYSEIGTEKNDSSFRIVKMPQDTIVKIWKAFTDNDLFALKDESELKDSGCHSIAMDGLYLDLTIITKTASKGLHYYAADVIQQVCPLRERKLISKCIDIIFSIDYRKYR